MGMQSTAASCDSHEVYMRQSGEYIVWTVFVRYLHTSCPSLSKNLHELTFLPVSDQFPSELIDIELLRSCS
jgi:hypothetical protein